MQTRRPPGLVVVDVEGREHPASCSALRSQLVGVAGGLRSLWRGSLELWREDRVAFSVLALRLRVCMVFLSNEFL